MSSRPEGEQVLEDSLFKESRGSDPRVPDSSFELFGGRGTCESTVTFLLDVGTNKEVPRGGLVLGGTRPETRILPDRTRCSVPLYDVSN